MNRKELHKALGEYFPHNKDFLVKVFFDKYKYNILEKAKNLKGQKFMVRFRDKEVKKILSKYNLKDSELYNALLDVLLEEYGTVEKICKEVEEWKGTNILQFV